MTIEERESMIVIIAMKRNYSDSFFEKMSDEEIKALYLEVMEYE